MDTPIKLPLTDDTLHALLDGELAPISDMRASAAYRSMVARNLLLRFQLETAPQSEAAVRLAEVAA